MSCNLGIWKLTVMGELVHAHTLHKIKAKIKSFSILIL